LRTRNPNRFLFRSCCRGSLSTNDSRPNYSHDFLVDTPRSSRYIVYLRHATIFGLVGDASSTSMWRPSEGDRCTGRWHGASNEPQALGAFVESFQGHVIGLSLHGWRLSRSLRTFLARLIVPFSSSELGVHAAAHIQRCGQTPRRYGVYLRCCSLPTTDQPLPLVPGVVPTAVLSKQMIQGVVVNHSRVVVMAGLGNNPVQVYRT
jgi:hypothetical protein